MDKTIEIGDYSRENGLRLVWTPGFVVEVVVHKQGEVAIRANREGLISLAQHVLTLAAEGVPNGTHIHLSPHDALEQNSPDLLMERID